MEIGVFLDFLKNKRLPYFIKIMASSKLKQVRITNVLVVFSSVRPILDTCKASHNISTVDSTPILKSDGNIYDDNSIVDWSLFLPDQRISALSFL